MKKYVALISLIFTQLLFAAPVIVNAPIQKLFIPSGYDNNDNVEVIVTGFFTNPCYARHKFTVDVVDDVIDIKITALSTLRVDEACMDMMIPFKEVVTIGNLQAGDYTIFVNKNTANEIKDKMKVNLASSQSVDDHIYAMVDYIDLGFVGGENGELNLVGWLPSDCLEFDRVEMIDNGKDVLSVLPIMKRVSDFCPMKLTPLNIPVKFDTTRFKSKQVLVFTRTIDGKSVNALISTENK